MASDTGKSLRELRAEMGEDKKWRERRQQEEKAALLAGQHAPGPLPAAAPTVEAPLPVPSSWQAPAAAPTHQSRGGAREPVAYSALPPGSYQYVDLGYTVVEVPASEYQTRPALTRFLLCCCPCCAGDVCGPRHRADLATAASKFIMVATLVEILWFFIEIAVTVASPEEFTGFLAPPVCVLSQLGGGDTPRLVHKLQLWRLATPMLLHAGPMHIIMNLYVQFLVGMKCETAWGTRTTATIYLLSGVGGNLLSSVGDSSSIGVGASGAIVGIVGARTMKVLTTWHEREPRARNQEATQAVFFLMMLLLFGTNAHVDNLAHLGGLVVGSLCALALWGEADQCLCRRFTETLGQATLRRLAAAAVALWFVVFGLLLFTKVKVPLWFVHC